jgi:5-methylcytosine-specific restriction endonuclease McrA
MTNAVTHQLSASLKPYIYPTLLEWQLGACADCGEEHEYFEIDHKRYADDLTINDLQLLCKDCHTIKTGIGHEHYLSGLNHCPTCTCNNNK